MRHLTTAVINLRHLTHNLQLLQEQAGKRELWPVIKANAYGHGANIIAQHLVKLGHHTLCVADVPEAVSLIDAGITAKFIIFSATLPEHSRALTMYDCEPVICTLDMIAAIADDAEKLDKTASIHLNIDTGMGRLGIRPENVKMFLDRCTLYPSLRIRGLMSHFACADQEDKTNAEGQIECFRRVIAVTQGYDIESCHMANSAAVLDLPHSHFDAVRPGIAIYGLRPSWEITNPVVEELKPVLEWKTRIVFLKEVPAGTGLSYGHDFRTKKNH